jgi:PAS domain S-box-containing protein
MKSCLKSEFVNSYFVKVISEIKGFAVFMMDTNGIISTWNIGCEDIKEYKKEDVIGEFYDVLFPDFLIEKNFPLMELQEANTKGRYETKNWRRKKSGELYWAYILLTKIIDEQGIHVGYMKITQDFSKEKKYEVELNEKNERLQKLNMELNNFVYTASHDLKAPLNNLHGLISELEEELGKEEKKIKVKDTMNHIKYSVEKFGSVISDMAITAKIETEQKEYSEQSFKEILEDIKYTLTGEISESHAIIHDDFSEPRIKYSRKNLRSILFNLISNAVKYGPVDKAPVIRISTKKFNGYILLEVADNGVGIKPNEKKKIFSLYQRLEGASSHAEGTGVGLAIVARVVDGNGGRIEIESEPDKGSTFKIYLKV